MTEDEKRRAEIRAGILAEKEAAAKERYEAAMHGVQSGIAMHMNYDPDLTTPKHLRVGVTSSLVNSEGLAQLLMDKGVFTLLEYLEAMADAAERERGRWTQTVQEDVGGAVEINLR